MISRWFLITCNLIFSPFFSLLFVEFYSSISFSFLRVYYLLQYLHWLLISHIFNFHYNTPIFPVCFLFSQSLVIYLIQCFFTVFWLLNCFISLFQSFFTVFFVSSFNHLLLSFFLYLSDVPIPPLFVVRVLVTLITFISFSFLLTLFSSSLNRLLFTLYRFLLISFRFLL